MLDGFNRYRVFIPYSALNKFDNPLSGCSFFLRAKANHQPISADDPLDDVFHVNSPENRLTQPENHCSLTEERHLRTANCPTAFANSSARLHSPIFR